MPPPATRGIAHRSSQIPDLSGCQSIGVDVLPQFTQRRDNSQTADIQTFINRIAERFLDYDAVIVSPAIGTGVDITFPNQQSLIDNVYGFFEARINTHFDIDQQISRVRHLKAIRIWITEQTFNFETDPDVIMREVRNTTKASNQLTGIDPDGRRQPPSGFSQRELQGWSDEHQLR
jgi:hypothetical protein